MTTQQTPDQLREAARKADQEAFDSFARSDTDGFLSQAASQASARRDRLQAEILENGGKAPFPALFDLQGRFVPARLIDGQYGLSWMLLDESGSSLGRFVGFRPRRVSTMTKKGFSEGRILRPAKAIFTAEFSATIHPTAPAWEAPAPEDIIFRTDGCDGCDHYLGDHGGDGCGRRCPCPVSWSESVI